VAVGESLPVVKHGDAVATGWDDPRFAVARNEEFEIGNASPAAPFAAPGPRHVPEALLAAHGLVADELEA